MDPLAEQDSDDGYYDDDSDDSDEGDIEVHVREPHTGPEDEAETEESYRKLETVSHTFRPRRFFTGCYS